MQFSILCTPTDYSDKTQSMFSTILLCLFVSKYDINVSRLNQACNQLGTPGVAKSSLRWAQIFQIMSNSFQLYPTDFSRKGFVPLVMGLG